MRAIIIARLLASMLALVAVAAFPGISTTLPISAELGTSIARDQFPLTIKLDRANLFLTEPTVLFMDARRIGIQVRFQAYDHRPDEGVAISETGQARFSGELDYDPGARQVLLHAPKIEQLTFDRDSEHSRSLSRQLQAAWREKVGNPLRSDLPPHPYLAPFRNNIQDLSFDGENIILSVLYQ